MMNILTMPPPDFITVGGVNYPINTDFRIWIKIENILSDSSVNYADKIIGIFSLAFVKQIPADAKEALSALLRFLLPFSSSEKSGNKTSSAPLFDFSYDGGYIYAAFLSQYGIDLTSSSIHWWRFLSLFASLDSCKFTEIMRIRGLSLSSVKDSGHKRLLRQLKQSYRLPQSDSDIGAELAKLI